MPNPLVMGNADYKFFFLFFSEEQMKEIMAHTVPYFRVIVIAGTGLGDLAKSPREVYSWKSPNLRIVLCYGLFSLRAKIRTYAFFFFMLHFFFDRAFIILVF